MVISAIIASLPDSFANFLESWHMFDVCDQTLDKFVSKLLERAKAMAVKEEKESAMAAVQAPSRGRGRSRGRGGSNLSDSRQSFEGRTPRGEIMCHYCKNMGHMKADCLKLQYKLSSQGGRRSEPTPEINNMVIEGERGAHEPYYGSNRIRFLGDSGCSSHMTPRCDLLHRYKPFSHPVPIRIGDDSILYALGSGELWASFGKISNVYYVPRLASNLFSISKAADNQMEIKIDAKQLSIFHPDGKLAVSGKREGGTYVLDLKLAMVTEKAMSATTLDCWNQRLNHLPRSLVVKMAQNKLVDGLRIV